MPELLEFGHFFVSLQQILAPKNNCMTITTTYHYSVLEKRFCFLLVLLMAAVT